MEKKIKLLSCPFCASDKVSIYKWNMSICYSISCGNEKCPMDHIFDNYFETKEKAASFWNRRYGISYDENFYKEE